MKLLFKILLYVFIALITNVNVVNASIPSTNIQEVATSFSYYTEIPKTVVGVVENDLVNCCQSEQNLVDYRNWAKDLEATAAKGGAGAYDGVRAASNYLQAQGVPRAYRKQILESFEVGTISLRTADNATFGLRFYGGAANQSGRYLFPTFTNYTNRAIYQTSW